MKRLAIFLAMVGLGHRLRNLLGVALLLGLTLGLSLFAVAGARRTQSSYPDFLRTVNASTISLSPPGSFDERTNAAVAALPEVSQSRTYVGIQAYAMVDDQPKFDQSFEASGTFDGRFFDQDRFTPTDGRLPDPSRADEVAVNELAAKRLRYRVGQNLDLGTYSMDQFGDPSFFTAPPAPKLRQAVTIVGIGVFPDEILQDQADRTTRLLLTPAFTESSRAYANYAVQGLVLRRGNRDIDTVTRELSALFPPGTIDVRVTSVDAFHALRATRPLALALSVFGVISSAAALVLVGQALTGLVRLERDQGEVLRALGAPAGAIVCSAIAGPTLAVMAGTALAVVAAAAASPLMPIGSVRHVAGGDGLDLDPAVLVFGSIAAALVLLGTTVWAAFHQPPHGTKWGSKGSSRRAKLSSAAASIGMPPTAVTGLRLAVEPGGSSSAVSAWSVVAGAAVAVAALVSAVTFGASLESLVHHPPLFGWNWNAAVLAGNGYDKMPSDMIHRVLDGDRQVASWSGAYFGTDSIDGADTPLLGMAAGSDVLPPITRGRDVTGPSEIVLGAATARRLHKGLGDSVTMAGDASSHTVKVVGIATLPTIGVVHAAHTSLGVGAIVVPELVPGYDRDITAQKAQDLGPSVVFVRYRPGTNPERELEYLRKITEPLSGFAGLDVLPVQRPAEIASATAVGRVPVFLALALALGSIVSLNMALGSSVRRRRRDLAVLKTLGFTPREVAATVSWQATMTVGLGLLAGVPIGIAAGQRLWRVFADQLNVVARPVVPLPTLFGLSLCALLIANVVAAIPSRTARRINAAVLLRST